ncbi:hypothetical protein EV426DRAFT_720847 [Tirmania nivea]|nr:hypothetical protein EV426DRAFT_720847 [Tirmania nivea]
MSGPGFYKFRCKNFYTHDCENWVWVNNSPCAACVAQGRESVEENYEDNSPSILSDVTLPFVERERLGYIHLETTAGKLSPQDFSTRYDSSNFETGPHSFLQYKSLHA